MWVFYILLLLPLAMQHFSIKGFNTDYRKKNQRALLVFFVLLTIMVSLRHMRVGNDTKVYLRYFENYSNLSWAQIAESKFDNELGFVYFNKLISMISKNSQIFFAITATLVSAMIYPTYKRLCRDASLTIVLYVTMSTFVFQFSGIRQMLAVGIGVVAYEFTRKKKLIPFILCVLIALMLHTSAFMLAFMYPLYHARITKKWLLVVVPALALVFTFNSQIFSVLAYIIEAYTDYDAGMTQTGAFTMILLFAIFTAFSFLIPDESKLDAETIGLRNFLLLSLALQMFAPLNMIAMRMNYYFIIFIPLLLPKIIAARSERWREVAIAGRHVMVGFFLVYFFLNAYTSANNLNVFPYHFFWESIG